MSDQITNLNQLQIFVDALPTTIKGLQQVCTDWTSLGKVIDGYVNGLQSANDPYALMPAVNRLIGANSWQGDAAAEFLNQAEAVRDYGLQLEAHATGPKSGGTSFVSALGLVIQDLSDLYNNHILDLQHRFDVWTGMLSACYRALDGWELQHIATPDRQYQFKLPTFAEFNSLQAPGTSGIISEFAQGMSAQIQLSGASGSQYYCFMVNGKAMQGSATLFLSGMSGLSPVYMYINDMISGYQVQKQISAQVFAFTWPWESTATADINNQNTSRDDLRLPEYYYVVAQLIPSLGKEYVPAVVFPAALDDSKLPKGTASPTTPSYNGGPPATTPYNTPGTSALKPTTSGATTPSTSALGKSGLPNTGTAAYKPVGSTGAYTPGTVPAGAYDPGKFGSGVGTGGAGSLAGYTPPSGTGLGGASGLGASGLSGAGTSGLGSGAGGLGAAGGGAGTAGTAAGRMPMSPMGAGAGGGKDGKERQRKAFLNEDDDVWGADGGEAPSVL